MHHKISEELRHEAPPAVRNNQSAYTETYFPCQKPRNYAAHLNLYIISWRLCWVILCRMCCCSNMTLGSQASRLRCSNSLSATPKHAQLMDMMFIQGYGDV